MSKGSKGIKDEALSAPRMLYNKIWASALDCVTVDGKTVLMLPWASVGPVLVSLHVADAPCAFALARVHNEPSGRLFGGSKWRVEPFVSDEVPEWPFEGKVDESCGEKRTLLRRMIEETDDSVQCVIGPFSDLLQDCGICLLGRDNRKLALQFEGHLSESVLASICVTTTTANVWNSRWDHWTFDTSFSSRAVCVCNKKDLLFSTVGVDLIVQLNGTALVDLFL